MATVITKSTSFEEFLALNQRMWNALYPRVTEEMVYEASKERRRWPLLGFDASHAASIAAMFVEYGIHVSPAYVARTAHGLVKNALVPSAARAWQPMLGSALSRLRTSWSTEVPIGAISTGDPDYDILSGKANTSHILLNPFLLLNPAGAEAVLVHELVHWLRRDALYYNRYMSAMIDGSLVNPRIVATAIDFLADKTVHSLAPAVAEAAGFFIHEDIDENTPFEEAYRITAQLFPPQQAQQSCGCQGQMPGAGAGGGGLSLGMGDEQSSDSGDGQDTEPDDGGMDGRVPARVAVPEFFGEPTQVEVTETLTAIQDVMRAMRRAGMYPGSGIEDINRLEDTVELRIADRVASRVSRWRSAVLWPSDLPDNDTLSVAYGLACMLDRRVAVEPGLERRPSPVVFVVLDTSGSMAKSDMQQVYHVLCSAQAQDVRVVLLHTDADVHKVELFAGEMPDTINAVGRCGTDLRVAFDWIERALQGKLSPSDVKKCVNETEILEAISETDDFLTFVITDAATPWPNKWKHGPVVVVLPAACVNETVPAWAERVVTP